MRSQLLEDGVYPGAAAAFGAEAVAPAEPRQPVADFDPVQPRDPQGRWTSGGSRGPASREAGLPDGERVAQAAPSASGFLHEAEGWTLSSGVGSILNRLNPVTPASAQGSEPAEETRRPEEEIRAPEEEGVSGEGDLSNRYQAATQSLAEVAPRDPALSRLSAPGEPVSASEVEAVEAALREAVYRRTCDFVRPDGQWIGELGTGRHIRVIPEGGLAASERDFDYLSMGAARYVPKKGVTVATFPGEAGTVVFRPNTSSSKSPPIDLKIDGLRKLKLHY